MYLEHKQKLRAQGVNLLEFLILNDLNWTDLQAQSSRLFSSSHDSVIVKNRFPYDFDASITHLVVWTKVPIASDPSSPVGDISPLTRRIISRFVEKTFTQKLGVAPADLAWFRNWQALQSMPQLSHIHVLVHNLTDTQLQAVLGTPGELLTDDDYEQCASSEQSSGGKL